MLGTLYNGMSGLSAHMRKLEVTGNNIANINTTGYKRQVTGFSELLRQKTAARGLPVLENGTVIPTQGSGTRVSSTARLFEQGTLRATGRSLDLAIEGKGFFRVIGADDTVYYTRDGSLHVDAQGRLVNSQGYPVMEGNLPESFSEFTIDETGKVTCRDGAGNLVEVGQIEITLFTNPAGLEETGANLYRPTEASGEPENVNPGSENAGFIRQGHLENSNVDLAMEVQFMIEAQRAFELNARSVTTADQLWSIANSLQK